jgi:myo-inositol 2-dehydrogenase/D-chiro-inositol 1-dehydrogenase
MDKKDENKSKKILNRRQFVSGLGAATLSTLMISKADIVWGMQANSKIKLGLIGCGGRGTWIANLFLKHGGYELAALADYFQERVDAAGEKFDVHPSRRFTGLSAYKRLIDSGVDAIAIESPPYFHPEQAAAGVDAGVHVYLAKPVAVDVPGCLSIKKSGEKASANSLCFLVDFQTRANGFFIEALRRIHQGDLGTFAFGESSYHDISPWQQWYELLSREPDNSEARLKAWGLDRALSGDAITEQNIHTLDVANWIMNTTPVYAVGTGGRKVRPDIGNCWDHFTCLFQYPNNVGITFSSRQFKGWDSPGGIKNRMFGSKGVLETEYGGNVIIRGENFYRGGRTNQIYQEGAENNISTFYKSVSEGVYDNPTLNPSVDSNLVTILGRTAAYKGEQVYWYQILKDTERLDPELSGLKD